MKLSIVDHINVAQNAKQSVFQIDSGGEDEPFISLAFSMPTRQFGDNKHASQRQRETIASFFWGVDILPDDCRWQQAGMVMAFRGLAYAVAETMEEGFLAANRMDVAPFVAAYISHDPYLRAVARGWSLGRWQGRSINDEIAPLLLVTSPFYRELFDFTVAVLETLRPCLLADSESEQWDGASKSG